MPENAPDGSVFDGGNGKNREITEATTPKRSTRIGRSPDVYGRRRPESIDGHDILSHYRFNEKHEELTGLLNRNGSGLSASRLLASAASSLSKFKKAKKPKKRIPRKQRFVDYEPAMEEVSWSIVQDQYGDDITWTDETVQPSDQAVLKSQNAETPLQVIPEERSEPQVTLDQCSPVVDRSHKATTEDQPDQLAAIANHSDSLGMTENQSEEPATLIYRSSSGRSIEPRQSLLPAPLNCRASSVYSAHPAFESSRKNSRRTLDFQNYDSFLSDYRLGEIVPGKISSLLGTKREHLGDRRPHSMLSTNSVGTVTTNILPDYVYNTLIESQRAPSSANALTEHYRQSLQDHPLNTAGVAEVGSTSDVALDNDGQSISSIELKNRSLSKGKERISEGYEAAQFATNLEDTVGADVAAASESDEHIRLGSSTSISPKAPKTPEQNSEVKIARKPVASGSEKTSSNTVSPSPTRGTSEASPKSSPRTDLSRVDSKDSKKPSRFTNLFSFKRRSSGAAKQSPKKFYLTSTVDCDWTQDMCFKPKRESYSSSSPIKKQPKALTPTKVTAVPKVCKVSPKI